MPAQGYAGHPNARSAPYHQFVGYVYTVVMGIIPLLVDAFMQPIGVFL